MFALSMSCDDDDLRHCAVTTASAPFTELYREIGAGGFSSIDGSVEFYGRVNALLRADMCVLDFGAGRGKDAVDDPVEYRRGLRTLRGKARMVIGADIDPIVGTNPSVDHATQIEEWRGLPFASESVDLLLCDHTFEHVRYPGPVAAELERILKPGGWICARTPNRWGYIAIGARLVPNRFHKAALRIAQPVRRSDDVFPTAYKMNTRAVVDHYFPTDRFRDCSYFYNPEPAYFGDSLSLHRLAQAGFRFLPSRCSAVLMIFKQKI